MAGYVDPTRQGSAAVQCSHGAHLRSLVSCAMLLLHEALSPALHSQCAGMPQLQLQSKTYLTLWRTASDQIASPLGAPGNTCVTEAIREQPTSSPAEQSRHHEGYISHPSSFHRAPPQGH